MGVVGEEVGVLLVLEVGDVGAVHHVLVGSGGVVVVGWLEALIAASLLEILLSWLGFFVFFVNSSIVFLILILLSKFWQSKLKSSGRRGSCGSRRTSPCLRSSMRGCGCCRGGSSLCGGTPWRWR